MVLFLRNKRFTPRGVRMLALEAKKNSVLKNRLRLTEQLPR